ncbi:NUDIX hydrolase [Ancylobacter sonchi]|uniref:NUDIX hydrolase n=1 Tax=Ancylobacter sonchi TaxID=1937790 RepID=UPI001BD20C34|nr:NUDIX hydrolase [Ancylobacter sonchi]MBS7535928.1 NUDIX hydrolase [Ancylobacter sonchi]
MIGSDGDAQVMPIDHLDLRLEPGSWDYAESRRAEVDAFFAAQAATNPALWNGRILVMARHQVADGVLTGRYRETDFASLLWWLRNGFPGEGVCNTFSMAALRAADGAFLLGRMASWTANAGRIYFAAGTPDLSDLRPDGTVDLSGSAMRELGEEMGVTHADVEVAAGWTGVFAGPRIALIREVRSPLGADALAARIRGFIASEERSELADVVVVRGPDEVDEAMPPFIRTYLLACWQRERSER